MMPAHSLPGDIPGLLQRGSSVSCPNDLDLPTDGWTVVGFVGAVIIIAHPSVTDAQQVMPEALTLDLIGPTGRAHAVWWVWRQPDSWRGDMWRAIGGTTLGGIIAATNRERIDDDAWWTPERINLLAEVVLRLAGRWS